MIRAAVAAALIVAVTGCGFIYGALSVIIDDPFDY